MEVGFRAECYSYDIHIELYLEVRLLSIRSINSFIVSCSLVVSQSNISSSLKNSLRPFFPALWHGMALRLVSLYRVLVEYPVMLLQASIPNTGG